MTKLQVDERADYSSQNFGDWSTADRPITGPFFRGILSPSSQSHHFKIILKIQVKLLSLNDQEIIGWFVFDDDCVEIGTKATQILL